MKYSFKRVVNQYGLPRDTNVQFFHTQLQVDVFYGHLVDTNLHKHQTIDWNYMQDETVMEGLILMFQDCGLYAFMGQRAYLCEMVIKQFFTIIEIDTDEKAIVWMICHRRYDATFANFASAKKKSITM